jgi:putative ABC transport system ATP-binding protein
MIHCQNLSFSYPEGAFELNVDSFQVQSQEQVAIVGSSGSGKTTLLYLMAGIYATNRGSVTINDIELSRYSETDRQDFRIASLGLVFQEFALLEYLSVLDNVLLPYRINPVLKLSSGEKDLALQLLSATGLAEKKDRYPHQLSQGERQRVAVCRAMINQPQALLCDEPTGNLDPVNRDQVLDLLFQYSSEHNIPLVLVTHDYQILDRFSRVVNISELV